MSTSYLCVIRYVEDINFVRVFNKYDRIPLLFSLHQKELYVLPIRETS